MTSLNSYVAGGLTVVVLIVGFFLIRGILRAPAERTLLLRPLPTLLILIIAILAPASVSLFFKGAIILGLTLSLLADVLLIMASTPSIIGVAINLIVYLLYSVAFASQTTFQLPTPWLLLLLLYAAFWYRQVAPSLRETKGDVIVYLIIVILMGWQALELGVQNGTLWAFAALFGTILLVLADSLRAPAQLPIAAKVAAPSALALYFVAQWLIAISVWGHML